MIAAQVGHIAARAVAAKKDAVLALELSEDMIEKVGGDDGRIDKTEYLTNVLVEAGTVQVRTTALADLAGAFPELLGAAADGVGISENAGLASIDGAFPKLVSAEALNIDDNDALASLDGAFPYLALVEESLRIVSNDALETIGAGAFPSLREVRRDSALYIAYNGNLRTIDGAFAALAAAGDIDIEHSDALVSVDAFARLNSAERIDVAECAALETLGGFGSLQKVDQRIHVVENPSLVDLSAFQALQEVGEQDDGPNEGRSIVVVDNAAGLDITGFSGLFVVEGSATFQNVDGNAACGSFWAEEESPCFCDDDADDACFESDYDRNDDSQDYDDDDYDDDDRERRA